MSFLTLSSNVNGYNAALITVETAILNTKFVVQKVARFECYNNIWNNNAMCSADSTAEWLSANMNNKHVHTFAYTYVHFLLHLYFHFVFGFMPA